MKIKSINKKPFEGFVYNFAVEDNNNYFANNVLVHNCYEGSTKEGKHGHIMSYKFLETLHPYTEVAINGNDLDHPNLKEFLEFLRKKRVFANITVHQTQFIANYEKLKYWQENKLVYGIGVSLVKVNKELLDRLMGLSNTVLHTIVGIISPEDLQALRDHDLKILFLGYKYLNRGKSYKESHIKSIESNSEYLRNNIKEITKWFKVVSFDNLALEQLEVQKILTPEEWEHFYMGDDGGFTFYIDAVKGEFAKNSVASTRYPIGNKTMDEMFQFIRNL